MAEPTSMTEPSSSQTSDRLLLRGGMPTQKNPFNFDGGDITINAIFNGKAMKGKVVSGSMASASSVWNKFLYPPWSSEGDDPVKELDFSEDDGEALLVLLRIVHFQFAKVPTSFKGSILPLYNIALLCEQYDCVHLTKFVVQGWCSRLSDTSLPLYAGDTRRKAYIAWAFGSVDIFLGLAKTLVLKCQSVQKIRDTTLKKLLAIPYNQATKSSLVSELGKRNLWPRKKTGDIVDSVTTIAGLVGDLDVSYPSYEGTMSRAYPWSYVDVHLKCTVDYKKEVAKILDHIPDPTLDCHIRHMQLRNGSVTAQELAASAKSGLADDLTFLHSTPVRKELKGYPSSSLVKPKKRVPTKKKHSPPEISTSNGCPRCSTRHGQVIACRVNRKKRPAS
ncbi:hypothetical protein BKA61DRAFT_682913 [Leptodontidium sp. MPI-SDFR-AT-0119]|nr:hypothetical protein BKA61DRAFT_682913 [Leptodontidium sp. MPI-SDFR-AT-0119]